MVATIGHQFPTLEFTVDPARVEEYILALGVDPVHGWTAEPGAIAPPGFLMYVTTYGAQAIHDVLDLDMFRTVFGGTDVEYLAPARVGDRLRVRPWISGITEKDGRSGRLKIVEITVEYAREDGTVVAVEKSHAVERV
jgi:acyl dehydratase